jgi:hypothetical protein
MERAPKECVSHFPQLLTTEIVKVFGRLHDDPIHTRRRQAFEKRHGLSRTATHAFHLEVVGRMVTDAEGSRRRRADLHGTTAT